MRLRDCDYNFCISLHKKLKGEVNGKVFTIVKDNALVVSVTMKRNKFTIKFDNFAEISAKDFTVDTAAKQIVEAYKESINKLYFK